MISLARRWPAGLRRRRKEAKILIALAHSVCRSLVRPTPLWAILYVNRRCNLNCAYCRFKDDSIEDPPIDRMLLAIDKIRELGCRFVSLTGGEPTLRKDLEEIIAHCRRRRVISYLNTNGTLLTRKRLSRLCESGLDMVNLSIDAVTRYDDSTKDIVRRGRTLRYLLDARKQYGFMLISNQVLCRNNFSSAPDLIEYMSGCHVPVAHGLQYPLPDRGSTASLSRMEETIDRLASMRRNGSEILTSLGYLEAIRCRLQEQRGWRCDAGNSFFVIDVDGRVGICDRHKFLDLTFDQVTRDNYKVLAERGRSQKDFQTCHRECLVNCAYETSYFHHHKIRFLADQILGISPRLERVARAHDGPPDD